MNNDNQGLLEEIAKDFKDFSKVITTFSVTLARIEKDLEYHIKRTELLEARADKQDTDLIALDRQAARWSGGLAISGWIVATLLAVAGLILQRF